MAKNERYDTKTTHPHKIATQEFVEVTDLPDKCLLKS